MKNNKRRGFTLIELLVVIAIIGVLSTLAVVALNNAREKSRDAKRASDIKQVQTALQLYLNDNNGYPVAVAGVTLGSAGAASLSSTNGLAATVAGTTYMGQVPANPTPGGADYVYTSATGAAYSITFTLEGQTGDLVVGAHTATADGIQ